MRNTEVDKDLVKTILEGEYSKEGFKGEYCHAEKAISKLEENEPIILDLGENIGLFSVKMKKLFPKSIIVAVEPEKQNYEYLQKNLQNYENGFIL